MEQGEKSENSTSDTSDTFQPGTGRAWDWIDLEERWNGLGSGFGAEQGLIGPGETEDEPGVKLGEETGETGRERVSATTFSLPGI